MKLGPAGKECLDPTRRTGMVVEHPRLTVIESSEPADPGGLEDALELLVKWAIRAHRGTAPVLAQAATLLNCSACSLGEST